jgi:hypothetical protein
MQKIIIMLSAAAMNLGLRKRSTVKVVIVDIAVSDGNPCSDKGKN